MTLSPPNDSRPGAAGDTDATQLPAVRPEYLHGHEWMVTAATELHDAAAFARRHGEHHTADLLEHRAAAWTRAAMIALAEIDPLLVVEQ